MLQIYDVSIDFIKSDEFNSSALTFFRDLLTRNVLDTIIQTESKKNLSNKTKVDSFYKVLVKNLEQTSADDILFKATKKILNDIYYDQILVDQFINATKIEYFDIKDLSSYTNYIKVNIPYDTQLKVDIAIASFVKRVNDGSITLIDINRPKNTTSQINTSQTNNSVAGASQSNTNSTTSTNTSQSVGGINNAGNNTDSNGNSVTSVNNNITNLSNATNNANQNATNSNQNSNSFIPLIDPNASLREIIYDSDYIKANKNVYLNHSEKDLFNISVVQNFLNNVTDKIYRNYLLLTLFENIDIVNYNKIFEDLVRERIRTEKFLGDSLLDTYFKLLNNPTYEKAVAKSKEEKKPMSFIICLDVMNEELPIEIAKQDQSSSLSIVVSKIRDELKNQLPDINVQFPLIDVFLNDLVIALDKDATDVWATKWKDLKTSMKSKHDTNKAFANFLTYDAPALDGATSNVNTSGVGLDVPTGVGVTDYYTPAIIAANYGNNSTVLLTAQAIRDYLKRIYPFFKTTTPYPYVASPFGE